MQNLKNYKANEIHHNFVNDVMFSHILFLLILKTEPVKLLSSLQYSLMKDFKDEGICRFSQITRINISPKFNLFSLSFFVVVYIHIPSQGIRKLKENFFFF